VVPAHCEWAFGRKKYAAPADYPGEAFSFAQRPDLAPIDCGSFREEVMKACALMDKRRKGRTVALAFTGGMDSVLLAWTLRRLGIPFELYFLDIWGLNEADFRERAVPGARALAADLYRVSLDRAYFYEELSLNTFFRFGLEQPTYLALTHLFDKIPKDRFILVGDGDLHRDGGLYASIAKNFGEPPRPGLFLPYSSTAVFYYLWANKHKRSGEFYFYSCTPGLVASMLRHPKFHYQFPFSSTRGVVAEESPEILVGSKSTNWDSPQAEKENKWIRAWIQRHAKEKSATRNWRPGLGTLTDLTAYGPR
jgi:hypothetical protein